MKKSWITSSAALTDIFNFDNIPIGMNSFGLCSLLKTEVMPKLCISLSFYSKPTFLGLGSDEVKAQKLLG